MLFASATDAAIFNANLTGTLRVQECTGRLGQYWAISDSHGTIEVALSSQEAADRINAVVKIRRPRTA